jgi:hypothetical protein|tara:strand:+ start:598 stop:819 length:222 start_codon:yes stop_codon:yes gene_type:complete
MILNTKSLLAIVLICVPVGVTIPFILDGSGSFVGSTVVAGIGLLALVGALLSIGALLLQVFHWLRCRRITEHE